MILLFSGYILNLSFAVVRPREGSEALAQSLCQGKAALVSLVHAVDPACVTPVFLETYWSVILYTLSEKSNTFVCVQLGRPRQSIYDDTFGFMLHQRLRFSPLCLIPINNVAAFYLLAGFCMGCVLFRMLCHSVLLL